MIYAGTGHRPPKLNYEWDGRGPLSDAIRRRLDGVEKNGPLITGIVSGMALGFDMLLAEWAVEHGYRVAAAIPFEGFEHRWPKKSRDRYYKILEHERVFSHVICPDPSTSAYQARNEWMVQNSEALIACWDGSDGGTANCVQYAQGEAERRGGPYTILRIDVELELKRIQMEQRRKAQQGR